MRNEGRMLYAVPFRNSIRRIVNPVLLDSRRSFNSYPFSKLSGNNSGISW